MTIDHFSLSDVYDYFELVEPKDFWNELYIPAHFGPFSLNLFQIDYAQTLEECGETIVSADRRYRNLKDFSSLDEKELKKVCFYLENRVIESFKVVSMMYVAKLHAPYWLKKMIHTDDTNIIKKDIKGLIFDIALKHWYGKKITKPKLDFELKERINPFYEKFETLIRFYEQTHFEAPYVTCFNPLYRTFGKGRE